MLVCKYASMQSMQVCKYTIIQVCNYLNIHVCTFIDIQVSKLASTLYVCTQVCKHESWKVYKYASKQVWKCDSMLICKNISMEGEIYVSFQICKYAMM